ncbi:hypothetical protein UFOVP658_118 [uncultured Caudovirales phage]|uniref:Uncharacterized protein n=1 Tax=uncultured Caudovirales phage TaxID=2100421 RepID=A0A6J5NIK2_9CAUD|nr:hypothetical protein UFOVP658_118 [uncultured Caudovirales phage]
MTGKSYLKTRVFLTSKLESPLSQRKSFEEAAVDFRKSVNTSSLQHSLNPAMAVKAMPGAGNKKDSDGKKRTNNGSVPGVENFGGYRYNPNEKGGEGKVFRFAASYESRINPRLQTPNWGWMDKEQEPAKKSKASIRIRKYKTNVRTGEIIEDSEKLMNPFTASGEDFFDFPEEKRLPGQTIGETMRGAGFLQRAARAAGLILDADGKMRCPPGTPAANQFTDSTGSNCFGFSANEIFDMAKRVASGLSSGVDEPLLGVDGAGVLTVEQEPIKNDARGWKKILGSLKDVSRVFSEDINGRSTIPSTTQNDSTPGVAMWFKDGFKRGKKSLKGMKQKVDDVIEKTGAKSTDRNDPNSDIINAFEKLRESGVVTTQFIGRPSPDEVKNTVLELLINRAGGDWDNLSDTRKKQLFKAELDRYYTVERAMLSQVLKSYMDSPEHMRSVDLVQWNDKLPDNSSAMASWTFDDGNIGGRSTAIDICMPEILKKLSSSLPSIEENERLRIDAVNASNPAEAATELNDFLVTSKAASEETAALIGGAESFARHIMAHEINHTIQVNAILEMIGRQVDEDGFLQLPDFVDKYGKIIKSGRLVKSFNEITNAEMQNLMDSIILKPKPGQTRTIIRELDEVVRQSQAVRWLAGTYVEFDKQTDVITTLEIMAEIATLREQGIIHGSMVDDALAWVDSYRDSRFNEERGISDAEETARFFDLVDRVEAGERVFEPINDSEAAAIENRRQENQKKLRKEQIENLDSDSLVDEIADLEFEIEQIDAKLNIADNPDLASRRNEAMQEMALARKTWSQKNPGYPKSALDTRVSRNRDEKDKLAPAALQRKKEKKELDRVIQDAESSNEEELIERIAFIEQRIRNKDTSEDDKKKLKKYKEEYRKAYRDKRKESGDESNAQKLNREIDSRVENRLNPKKKKPEQQSEAAPKTKGKKPKPIKKPKNQAATTRLAESERRRLFNEASEKEKKALVEMSDVSDKDIAKILDPETRNLAINFIRQTNDALVALGYGYDPESSEQGSLENQMDNILMPVLDIIERSELLNSVEIQIEMDLTPEQMSGDDLTPITVDGFISGNLIDEQNGVKIGGSITWSRKTGRGKQRVVVQLEEGQRGYYPHWSDSSEERPDNFVQKVVSPPGRIEIVERRQEKDGSTTFIARVVEQKNTEEILDGILTSDPNNEIPPAAKLQIEKSVNKHIVERRSRGLHNEQKTPSSVKEVIEDKNNQSFDDVNDSGGSFGEPIDADYADSVSELEDGPDEASEEMFGKPQTREERRKDRVEKFAEITKALQELFESKESNEELGISFEDIDPEIIDLINNTSPAELEDILADEAEKVHEEIDKRPRVNVWETGLEEIIEKPSPATEQKPAQNTGRPTVGKKRTKATQAIENVVGNGANRNQASARAENELNRIQSLLDGDDYTNYGGRGAYTARNIIQGKFGTTNLRELTNEQISEVIDELKNLSYANPANQGRQIGQMASRLHDFLDIRDMQNSRDYSDPYDRFKIDSLRTSESPSLDDGFVPIPDGKRPYMGGSLSSGKGGMGRGIAARVATRLVSSQIDKTDMSDENKEKVKLATSLIASYAAKGPQGAATSLAIEAARRGGREVAELTIDKLVKTGKMTPDQARVAMQAVDKIAPEGVPDSVMEALSDGFDVVDRFVDERVLTDENKERLINATEEARDAAGRAREQIGESARGASSAAKEKLNLLKRKAKGNREKEIPSIDDAIYDAFDSDDPFADPSAPTPAQPPAAARSAFDEYDIFGDAISSPEASPEPESRQRRIRRAKNRLMEDLRREDTSQDDDPFADYLIPPTSRASSNDPFSDDPFDAFTTAGRSGLSSGASRTRGLSSGQNRTDVAIPTRRADLAISPNREKEIQADIDSKNKDIEDLEDLKLRISSAIGELKSTGSWQGEKYKVRVNEAGVKPPTTYSKEQIKDMADNQGISMEDMIDKIVNESNKTTGNIDKKINDLNTEINKIRTGSEDANSNLPETSISAEELLSDPRVKNELENRTKEINKMTDEQRERRFSDPSGEYTYVVHWGASKLEGGSIDPSRSRGQVNGSLMGNTRQINDETARAVVQRRNEARRSQLILEEIKKQIEETGKIDFEEIAKANPSDPSRADKARRLLGVKRGDEDRFFEPAPGIVEKINGLTEDQKNIISRLDGPANQLEADDFQYSSSFRASYAKPLFGSYGGRYEEDGSTGIHVFKVKLGEDAIEENNVGETHLVGKHTPIASLVARNDPDAKRNPAVDTWLGWLDEAIQQDIQRSSSPSPRSGLSSGASRSEARQGRKLADTVIARDKGGTDNSTNPLDYIPLGPASVDSLLKKNPFSKDPKGGRGKAAELIDDLSVDWNAQAEMASVLSEIMSTNRGMQSLVQEFGMPAIFVSQLIPLPDRDSSSGVSAKYWGGAYGVYSAHQGIIAINPEVMRDRYKLEHVLRHEMAHAFHSMAAARSDKAKKKMQQYTTGAISEGIYQAEQSGGDLSLANFDDIGQLTPEMKEAADFMNNFGFIVASQNVMEFVAEVTTYLTSPNESDRNKVSQRAIAITADYFGLSDSEFKKLIKYQDMFDSGFTSRGENTSPTDLGGASGTPTLQSSFDDPFGDSPTLTDPEPQVREGGRLFRRKKGKESVPVNAPNDDPLADWDPFA